MAMAQRTRMRIKAGVSIVYHPVLRTGRVCTTNWGEEICTCGEYALTWDSDGS